MKLWSSLLVSAASAQYADEADEAARWGGYDYTGGFNYVEKNDGGLSAGYVADDIHKNGLYCWMCDERLNLGQETESGTVNAYTRCLENGMLQECKGEQRTCMFEERRRNGVIYSVCTGCKQTDACLALWRRNQRFTLPFMNFGDMSVEHHADGKPIYVDDECTTYENVADSSDSDGATAVGTENGLALSYAKFSYDTATDVQANGQMSQWESSCRWCCAAKNDKACNLDPTSAVTSPFKAMACTNLVDAVGSLPAGVQGGSCNLSSATGSFFQPFMLADPRGTDKTLSTTTTAGDAAMYIDDFIKTAMADLAGGTAKNPVTGEGRNSLAMDKYKFRGNQFTSGSLGQHVFEHQSDLPSQENRDFFDRRANNGGK